MGITGKNHQKLFVLLFALMMLLCGVAGAFAEEYTIDINFCDKEGNPSPYSGTETKLYVYFEIKNSSTQETAGWFRKDISIDSSSASAQIILDNFSTIQSWYNPNTTFSSDTYTIDSDTIKIFKDEITYDLVHGQYAPSPIEGYKFTPQSCTDSNCSVKYTITAKESTYKVDSI